MHHVGKGHVAATERRNVPSVPSWGICLRNLDHSGPSLPGSYSNTLFLSQHKWHKYDSLCIPLRAKAELHELCISFATVLQLHTAPGNTPL